MMRVVSQKLNGDGTMTVNAENFANGVAAQAFNGATVAGTVSVGPYDEDCPGSEAWIQVALTITPPA